MQITLKKTLSTDTVAEFHINENSDKDALLMLAFLSEPMKCPLEGFKDAPVKLNARRVKGQEGTQNAGKTFTYIERVAYNPATKQRATSTMGEYQEGGYYWKQWEIYTPDQQTSSPAGHSMPQDVKDAQAINPEDVPF